MTSLDDPSGLALAELAYDAGAVDPADEIGNCDVHVHFVVRGDELHARSVAEQVTLELLARSDVAMPIDSSVSER